MLVIGRPKAIIYNWKSPGLYEFVTTTHTWDENNTGWIDIISIKGSPSSAVDIMKDLENNTSEIIVAPEGFFCFEVPDYLNHRVLTYAEWPDDMELANQIFEKIMSFSCTPHRPKFSVFTPSFKTGDRIRRTYEGLKSQILTDWEWIVVDDSPIDHSETWDILKELSDSDIRIKPYRISPTSGGRVGMVKHRACSLSTGEWLVELDHDDYLLPSCLKECWDAHLKFPEAGFIYSDVTEIMSDGSFREYDHTKNGDFYARPDNWFNFGYSGHTWTETDGLRLLQHHYPSINPLTIRFNISMPNHVRVWRKDVYDIIGGHRDNVPLADDFELIIRTFLNTRIIHIPKVLYIQYNNSDSTVDNNSFEINRRARQIRKHYDRLIHERILELGFEDWEWDYENDCSIHPTAFVKTDKSDMRYFEKEQVLNYTYE